MYVDRFLYQVQQNLPKHEGVITWIEDSAVKVGYGDTGSFEIRYPGGVCYNAATEKTEEFDRLVEEADKTFKTVKEYIDLMEKAPELSARDFNMPYKLLAEFNGVVLGGIEHQSNRSFEFTTWSYGYIRTITEDGTTHKMTREEVKTIVFRYVFVYYNQMRVYTANPGGWPPAVYRRMNERAAA